MLYNLFIDSIAALWIVTIFVIIFFWLPGKIFHPSKAIPSDSQMASYWVRMSAISIAAVLTLNALHLFNWFAIVFFYSGCVLLGWLLRDRLPIQEKFKILSQHLGSAVLDRLDRGFLTEIPKTIALFWERSKKSLSDSMQSVKLTPKQMPSLIALTMILVFAVLIRFEHPLLELRFANPDSYEALLATRQILVGEQPQINHLPVLPALAAVVSLLGAIDAMYAIRFLEPILGIILVLSVGYCVRALTGKGAAALAAMFSLGTYLFESNFEISARLPHWLQQWLSTVTGTLNVSIIRQWLGDELEIGATFLLLALAFGADLARRKQKSALIDIFCCLAILTVTAPSLLILAPIGGIGLLGSPVLGLVTLTIAWVVLGLLSAIPQNPFYVEHSFLLTLPLGLSLLWGLIFIIVTQLFRIVLGRWTEIVCSVIFLAISINFLLPFSAHISYLEYDMAARKTLELRGRLPLKSWAIAAPIEQFSESYSAGWYEDLALFVDKYATDVGKEEFNFPHSVPHLFVFVEKQPLVLSLTEVQHVSHSLLSDHTHRHYRSTAGRASLEFEALHLCEAYRRTHSNVSIYYEDEELRIYHFPLASSRSRS